MDPCPRDGALRYIAIREKGNRYEFLLLHILLEPGGKKRKTIQKTLASVRLSSVDIHNQGKSAPRQGGAEIEALLEIRSQLGSIIAQLQKGHNIQREENQ